MSDEAYWIRYMLSNPSETLFGYYCFLSFLVCDVEINGTVLRIFESDAPTMSWEIPAVAFCDFATPRRRLLLE